jgi:hypothetical protein
MPRFSVKVAPGVRVYGGRSSRRSTGPSWFGWFLAGLLLLALLIAGVNSLFGIGGAAERSKPATTSVPLHCEGTSEQPERDGYGVYKCPQGFENSYSEPKCPDGTPVEQGQVQGVNTVTCEGRVVGKFE